MSVSVRIRVARPERFELPTFWFVGGFRTTRQHTQYNKSQRNQRRTATRVGPFWLALYPVHGKLHGKFVLAQQQLQEAKQQFKRSLKTYLGQAVEKPIDRIVYRTEPSEPSLAIGEVIHVEFRAPSELYARRPLIVSAHNQNQYSDDRRNVVLRTSFYAQNRHSASAQIPDVRLQTFEYTMLANTFRVGFRESHAA